jgi:hypothetical protein
MASHCGNLIDVLVLVLDGCAHGRVSHDIHDRKQVFGRTVHLSSKAMTRAIAYPKNLVLPLHPLPFTLAVLNARLQALIAFGTDIFVLGTAKALGCGSAGPGMTRMGWTTS